MTLQNLNTHISLNSKDISAEFKRLFHGRGGLYDGFKHLTIDSIDTVLSVALYDEDPNEGELLDLLKAFIKRTRHETLILQRRYKKNFPTEVIVGELSDEIFALENGMKFRLNLLSNRNSGYFADMKIGREFVRENAKGKSVLNLFSYTCAFSVAALFGSAKSVSNIDMSKASLSIGRSNHHINDLNTKGVNFAPYNILKSFSRIKKKGPYDLIIIDPPSFQRGSFEATKDYRKIIAKLPEISSDNCILLACLNSPELDSSFLKELICELAPEFEFKERLPNLKEFESLDEERSLKNLVFKKNKVEKY
ncbi:MAG: class I SAM-dependent methyltransferase [Sulfurimonas sp.]|uniref:class I SAM-dependent methyltransferase n=1 Tax=Sulfurimonas sp. TaxID=2022749 RepID=UPI0025F0F121|nr:class I SAM-dependent methyltransferase [Sulfurimonas sp.]MCK9491241.1 class I SAM-dependent methyltransferase [Sulfurimonas sp.]